MALSSCLSLGISVPGTISFIVMNPDGFVNSFFRSGCVRQKAVPPRIAPKKHCFFPYFTARLFTNCSAALGERLPLLRAKASACMSS